MTENNTTPSGEPSEEARKKYSATGDGRFPIYDRSSAIAALRLRGKGTTAVERKKIVDKAAAFVPQEAKQARMADLNR